MYIDWDEKYTTGVEIVDKQHRRLIHILNGLYEHIGRGQGEAALQGMFGELQRYAAYHFDTEEGLLKRHAVWGRHAAGHIEKHEEYRRRLGDLQVRYLEGERLVPIQVFSFVCAWWIEHIVTCDRVFASMTDGVLERKAPPIGEDARWLAK